MSEFPAHVIEFLTREVPPGDSVGVIGRDPEMPGRWRPARAVFPVFGNDNAYRLYGREIETARETGAPARVRVAKVLSRDTLIRQALLWAGIAEWEERPGLSGDTALRHLPERFPPALEVRAAVVMRDDVEGEVVFRLQTGEVIDVTIPTNIASVDPDAGWLLVGDDSAGVERNMLTPIRQESVFIPDASADRWVLAPATENGYVGQLLPLSRLPLVPVPGMTLEPMHQMQVVWVGADTNGEPPMVLSREQVDQLRDGTASDMLRNALLNSANGRIGEWKEFMEGEVKVALDDATARSYGLHTYLRTQDYLPNVPSLLFPVGTESGSQPGQGE